jgi:ribonuclease Z
MVRDIGDALTSVGQWRSAKVMHDIPPYHTSPVDAARIANEADAKLLVFTHLLPMLPNDLAERMFLHGVSSVRRGGVRLGEDGMLVRLTAGKSDIDVSHL